MISRPSPRAGDGRADGGLHIKFPPRNVKRANRPQRALKHLGFGSFAMTLRWMMVLSGALLVGTGSVSAGDKTYIVRDLAGRVGPVIGSALACRDIARPRIQVIVDKFTAVITENSSNEAERSDLTLLLDRNVADGRSAVTTGRIDCLSADRQLADLERSNGPRAASPR